MRRIRKFWEVKAADASLSEGGSLAGIASVMGNLDSADDVIFPGAYTEALPRFRKEGFVAMGHEWDELPIAMPTLIEERGNALYAECEFHSTDDAQEARAVCVERLAKGLSVGLSVGFLCSYEDCMVFETGENLLAFAAANGYDLSLFDRVGITAHKDWCRAILRVARLVEYSIVPIPANGKAQAIAAKCHGEGLTVRDYEELLRDAGLSTMNAKRLISGIKALSRDAEQPIAEPLPITSPAIDEEAMQKAQVLIARLDQASLFDRLNDHRSSSRG